MKRPVGVTIIAVLAIIGGLIQLLTALVAFGLTSMAVPGMEFAGVVGTMGFTTAAVLLVLAVASIAFGIGALMLKSWAWITGIVLFGISLVGNVILMLTGAFTTSAVLSALIAAVVLAYLFTDNVRAAFGHERGARAHRGGPVVHA